MLSIKKFNFCLFLCSAMVFSQQKQADSVKVNNLEEVVVTGQFEPQSIKKSVFNVRVITSADIKNLAATTLSDVLTQYLNITVRPDGATGRSTVSLFGLDEQYFKIFVDNVPLVNESGLGNNIDLSQINLNDIERIEIVEGSMGVTHGANALTGVLNIISKKASKNKWDITVSAQEETVGKEFELFDKGRHIQNASISHTINKNWYVSIGGNRNDFKGFLDQRKGKEYIENDLLRGYRLLPKEQLNGTGLISYHKNDFRIFYKFEYYDENIDFYNQIVQSGFSIQSGSYRYSSDKRYMTHRYFHNLNASGKIAKLNYNVSVSLQKQSRDMEEFRYNLYTRSESMNITQEQQSMEVLYSTGTVSNLFSNKKIDMQLGYEAVNTKGYSLVQEANQFFTGIKQTLENYDFFVSSEIRFTEKFSVRPGLRVSSQSKFKDQYASSLGLRYLFDNGVELRGLYGTAFRTPSFDELYSKIIFDGHHFTGNENLIPETGISYEASMKKVFQLDSGLQISNTLSASFLNMTEKIESVLIRYNPETGNPEWQYINVSKHKMWNFASMNQLSYQNWSLRLGAGLVGISQRLENGETAPSSEKYLYTLNLNCNVSYTIPKWQTTFSAYYKYTGKTQQFELSSSEYTLSELDPMGFLDASLRKGFFENKLEATVGARNLLDLTTVNRTRNSDTSHPLPSESLMAYGRSYFLKLTYNLNF